MEVRAIDGRAASLRDCTRLRLVRALSVDIPLVPFNLHLPSTCAGAFQRLCGFGEPWMIPPEGARIAPLLGTSGRPALLGAVKRGSDNWAPSPEGGGRKIRPPGGRIWTHFGATGRGTEFRDQGPGGTACRPNRSVARPTSAETWAIIRATTPSGFEAVVCVPPGRHAAELPRSCPPND